MSFEFINKFNHKITDLNTLLKKIKSFPREKKIIVCHGVFDVVHPGHIRHLVYASSKSPILVVSLTSDRYINKGTYRPHIPEKVRALNIAALEIVNYVIIDDNKTPINLIKKLKPDYFAKGFEYSSRGLPKETKLEQKTVKSYGGNMVFTPGDIVYSSSKFINTSKPNIKLENLLSLMHHNKISFNLLKNTLKSFKKFHIHVLGDTIIDKQTITSLIGGNTKTPTHSVSFQEEKTFIGGAAIVARHLKASGAKVTFTTVTGKDKNSQFLESNLKKEKIKINIVKDSNRPTTVKNAIIASGYRLLKIDTLDNSPIINESFEYIKNKLKKTKSDAVIFSDFRHGIFNSKTTKELCSLIPNKAFKVADSQVATRWGNISDFKNFDLITPNEKEARSALSDQDSTVISLAFKLKDLAKYKNLILTLGDKGLFSVENKKKNLKNSYFSLDSFSENPIDPVGSGDALMAYATLTMLSTKSLVMSSIIGSIAAWCECEFDGNIPITINRIEDKINFLDNQTKYLK